MLSRVRWILIALVILLLGLAPAEAFAAEPRTGDRIVVGAGETVDDDLYVFGGAVDIQGTIRGDLVVFAGNIVVSGTVTGDLIAAGGTVVVPGRIGGSVRLAGGTATIDGSVARDLLVGAGTVTLGQGASVGRDLWLGTGNATVGGKVGRNVLAQASDLTIDGAVAGDVIARVSSLRLTDRAQIGGNLVYTSEQSASIASGATVRGRVEHRTPAEQPPSPASRALAVLIGWLRALVGLTALGLIFVLLFPAFSRRTIETLRDAPWTSLGLGCGTLVVVPIAALVLFVVGLIVGGWWLGLMALALYGIALPLGFVVASLFVGRWVLEQTGRPRVHRAWTLVLGLVILTLVVLVPILGGIVGLVAVLFGLGALVLAAARIRQTPAPAAGG